MFIKTVIIDGFKSYGKRTEITGFDPEFTAITGLNGTGKSNVLDAICFVLGITNLGSVRANSLQELVYKGGQCGVLKATVTIIFDNTNALQSPMGYEKCSEIMVARQVVVGGKNKYMINGKTVVNKRVADLFCSVQLNINNPNFLIMQGRITKVLNMKPPEILRMIEEAAGTSMYETKRDETNKMLDRKDGKLKEMDALIDEEILPKLSKLRSDRELFQQFQKLTRDLDYFTRIIVSASWMQCRKDVTQSAAAKQATQKAIADNEQQQTENQATAEQLDAEAAELRERIDAEAGGVLADSEQKLQELTRGQSAQAGARKAAEQGLALEQRNLVTLQRGVHEDEKALAAKEREMSTAGGQFEQLKSAEAADREAYELAKRRYEAVRSGLSTDDASGEATSLQEQLMQAKRAATESATTVATTDMEVRQKAARLRTMQGQRRQTDATYERDQQALAQTQRECARLETALAQLDYTDGRLEQLEQQRRELNLQRRDVQQQWEQRNGARYELQFVEPEPGFDRRRRVLGRIGMLFTVPRPEFAMALSQLAGGSLFNVVVDNEQTSKLLLQRGKLQTFTVFMPLARIQARPRPEARLRAAQQLVGADNVWLALDCVEFEPAVEVAVRYVFGNTLICRTMEQASKVCYHPQVQMRVLTLGGDQVDPSGSLEGGAAPKGEPLVLEFAAIQRLVRQMKGAEEEARQLGEQAAQLRPLAQRFAQQRDALEAKRFELEQVQKRLAASAVQQHEAECEELQRDIDGAQRAIEEARAAGAAATTKAADLEAKLSDAAGYRERELRAATEALQAAKKRSESSATAWSQREQAYELLRMQIDELRTGVGESGRERADLEAKIAEHEQQIAAMSATAADVDRAVAELKQQLKAQRDAIGAKSRELKAMGARKEKLAADNQRLQLEVKKRTKELEKLAADGVECVARQAALEAEHAWIEKDQASFGGKNTRYDYAKTTPQQARTELRTTQQRLKEVERNLNPKAMMALEREETQFKTMTERKRIIGEDKTKIRSIIVDLDDQKRIQVQTTHTCVSENFGNIFGTLLPGAMAKLVPVPAPNGAVGGLIVRVGFNGLWKEGLGELSGGQRSLVALSLILAMLKYKPAPLYILDEVDAALDMSHTQNIGKMLKMHFTNSQFIIVSLKDGMFNNANVLFKTKFENGVSAITRTVAAHLKR